MAIINCPYCGKYIIKNIANCPHCGLNVKQVNNKTNAKKTKKSTIALIIFAIIFFYVMIFGGLFNDSELSDVEEKKQITLTEEERESVRNKLLDKSDECTHIFKKWKVIKKATFMEKGEKQRLCRNCKYCETKEYNLTDKQKKQYLINNCSEYTYKQIARNPDKYKGKYAKLTGEVVQTLEYTDETILRVNITLDDYGFYSDTVYVVYNKSNSGNGRILEEDIITMYGILDGLESYESVLGSQVNIPKINAYYININ